MKAEQVIPIRLVQDEVFRSSFWSYDPEKVINEASEMFSEEFGLAGFKIVERKNWDSCGSDCLRNFPENIIRQVPNISVEKLSGFLIRKIKYEMVLTLTPEEE